MITDAYRCLCFGGSYEINDKFLVDNGLDNHGFFFPTERTALLYNCVGIL